MQNLYVNIAYNMKYIEYRKKCMQENTRVKFKVFGPT